MHARQCKAAEQAAIILHAATPGSYTSAAEEAQASALRSGKGTAGRATSDVSSRKIRVSLKGMAYRKVGSFLLLA